MGALSGKTIGADYLRKVESFLANSDSLPMSRDGSLNVTAIAEQAGIPKQSIYKNPAIRQAIEKAKTALGIPSWSERRENSSEESGPTQSETEIPSQHRGVSNDAKRLQAAERRISALEQQNAAFVAENFELRRQLKDLKQKLGRQDMIIDTGRRVPAPMVIKDA